eukprot:TRINITY_DN2225_c2_g2_i3.p1 TRINITY_DN2225_c2_g2~~TRINITY_DN2225_c2_g2_i3.p1  ORF type:complete len:191 (+),score=19.10 TRINITY_DN2225_c2_g2_i3:99-671(+)
MVVLSVTKDRSENNNSWMYQTLQPQQQQEDNDNYNNYSSSLERGIRELLKDSVNVVVFAEDNTILAGNYTPKANELSALKQSFQDRMTSIRNGLSIDGARYEVHRWHPPLVYGRSMQGSPTTSRGAALMKIENGFNDQICYTAITYDLPNVSARMVPLLQQYAQRFVKNGSIELNPETTSSQNSFRSTTS